jgi:hypothetical protein
VIHTRVNDILADGVITDDERKYLHDALSQIIGGEFKDTGATIGLGSTTLPINAISEIRVDGCSFCFTGAFLYGTRKGCERAIAERQGLPLPRVRKDLDYLVIGALASPNWTNSSHGARSKRP